MERRQDRARRAGAWRPACASASGSTARVLRAPPTALLTYHRHLLCVAAEDAAFIVADKPAGVIVEPLPGRSGEEVTLLDLLRHHLRHDARGGLYVVHRIDRDTSGLVLFARTAEARDALKDQFQRRTPVRVYQAVVEGVVRPARGSWIDQLAWHATTLRQRKAHATDARGKEAVAEYRVMEQFAMAALVEVSLVTGKRNQIPVQAGLRGHPLLGQRQDPLRLARAGGRPAAPGPAGAPRLAPRVSPPLDRPGRLATDGGPAGGPQARTCGVAISDSDLPPLALAEPQDAQRAPGRTWPRHDGQSRCPTHAARATPPSRRRNPVARRTG